MLTQIQRPTIFAHRGSSLHAPENTLAAFELAVRQGADAIELDAKLSGDGYVVVIHDQSVDRTTDGTGLVGKMPLAAIKELDAGSFFDIVFQGEKIPTLEEVFESVGSKTYINIELTNYATPRDRLPEIVALLIRKHNLAERILFSSFNPWVLERARRSLPEVPCGLLAVRGIVGWWARSWPARLFPHQALHPELSDVTPGLVARAHRQNQRVHVYTVNDVKDMQRLFSQGVDGIFTDDPLKALKVLTTPGSGSFPLAARDNR